MGWLVLIEACRRRNRGFPKLPCWLPRWIGNRRWQTLVAPTVAMDHNPVDRSMVAVPLVVDRDGVPRPQRMMIDRGSVFIDEENIAGMAEARHAIAVRGVVNREVMSSK